MAKILIIEDEKGIADSLVFALQQEGLQTHWSITGAQGLDYLRQNETDLVLLDVGLPDINGFDLLREIRASNQVPVLFLTARSEEIDRIVGLELGADDYITKPFSPRELMARVKAHLRRSQVWNRKNNDSFDKSGHSSGSAQGSDQQDTQRADFIIDEHKYVIYYKSAKLPLSRYEFLILQLLLKRTGWVFPREKIMEIVWDDPYESFDRTVDTHIKTIRQKLKKIYADWDPILTHRGLGYAIDENVSKEYVRAENKI